MTVLTTQQRNNLKSNTFAIPGQKAYPITDRTHAANALARVAQHGTPAEKKAVIAKVCGKFPDLPTCKARRGK